MEKTIYDILTEQELKTLEKSTEEFKELVKEGFDWDCMEVIKGKEAKTVLEDLASSSPSDLLIITNSLFCQFNKLLEDAELDKKIGCPLDIFKANTIPIHDCLIEVELPDQENLRYRVTVLTDEDGNFSGGYFTYQEGDMVTVWPMIWGDIVNDDEKIILCHFKAYTPNSEVGYKLLSESKKNAPAFMTHFYFTIDIMFKLWYAFQICLLNPDVKDILMKKTGKEKLNGFCCTSKKDKMRKTKYVKRHRVESDIFNSDVNDSIERRTLCWYVIGHWRNYSNGKKTFVKPYWKGPLRHMEKNLDKGRERVV